jgi:hypothetical protein
MGKVGAVNTCPDDQPVEHSSKDVL